MNHHQIRAIDMAERLVQYFKDHTLPKPIGRVASLRAELEGVLARVRLAGGSQDAGHSGYRSGAAVRRHFLDALLLEMRDMNVLARALDPLEFAGVSELFRMPRSQAVRASV